VFAYLYGDESQAGDCFDKLRKIARDTGRGDEPLYEGGLEQFMTLKLADVMEIDISNLRQFLDAMIQRAILDGLAKGRVDTFERFVRIAHAAYDRRYGESVAGSEHLNPEARLPPFPELLAASYENVMRREAVPLLVRARIWAWSPDRLQERSWPRLRESLVLQAAAAGLDPERAFPQPPSAADPGEASGSGPATPREEPP
jgi:hypothetical protein